MIEEKRHYKNGEQISGCQVLKMGWEATVEEN